ncbi:MAG TPA: DUF1697 domain-containing protein [Anaerolineae bacterium]
MPRYFAFLRAINVGGHTVKMDRLRELFAGMGFDKVETFIASGNLIFDARAGTTRNLERKIEARLNEALGYNVATFIRTEAELGAIAVYKPFSPAQLAGMAALNIAFLAEPLDKVSAKKVMALRTAIDEFHLQGRELYWLCRKKQSESTFSNQVLEKTIGRASTLRGVETIKKLAQKYGNR